MDLNNTDDNSFLLRFQRSMSLSDPAGGGDYSLLKGSSSSLLFNNNNNKKRLLIRSTILSILFGFVGWYYPRYLIQNETQIHLKVPPYQETTAGDIILDFTLNEKLVDPPTIPGDFLVLTSVWVPLILILGYIVLTYYKTTSFIIYWMEVTTAISAFATSIGLCEGTTQLLKLFVQRRRPNFYSLCEFDFTKKQCMADLKHIREANFSFPSGHSSLACGGMTFLVLFFIGKWCQRGGGIGGGGIGNNNNNNGGGSSNNNDTPTTKSNNNTITSRQKPPSMLLYFLTGAIPWGWALFVGASRLVDKWHHPSDVVAGLSLGFATVSLMYHVWYPPCTSVFAGIPRMLLQQNELSLLGDHRNNNSSIIISSSSGLSSNNYDNNNNKCANI